MPEQIHLTEDRTVWGSPNRDEHGQLIRASDCRSCVHWSIVGWLRKEERYGVECALRYASFPHRKDCPNYAREPLYPLRHAVVRQRQFASFQSG